MRGRLTPEAGALLMRALDAARDELYRKRSNEDDPPSMAQQQADALTLLAETALHRGTDPGPAGERYQVVVHVDAAVLANADHPGQSAPEDGARIDPVGEVQKENAANGLQIDPQTLKPLWSGEPFDPGWAIDVLHPGANPGPPAAPSPDLDDNDGRKKPS